MKFGAINFSISAIVLAVFLLPSVGQSQNPNIQPTVTVESGLSENKISKAWRNALISRMSAVELDSMSSIQRPLTKEELEWVTLIKSRTDRWNIMRDSLEVPFGGTRVADSVIVLLGAFGRDDGFTFQLNTICFDVTALSANYGVASESTNTNLIDRLYAHEFTHLIHKTWFRERQYKLVSFRDSVLWECLYEGIGMYRSLSEKWFPRSGVFPDNTIKALNKLYPQFVDHLIEVEMNTHLTEQDKYRIVRNLSRGPVSKKWGALPVAMWLALESNGDDTRLIKWMDKGSVVIIDLAKKYLSGNDLERFSRSFH